MQSLIQHSINLRKEHDVLLEKIKENPNDREAIQNQFEDIIGKQVVHNAELKRIQDRLQGETELLN